jgi:hypothetical protein
VGDVDDILQVLDKQKVGRTCLYVCHSGKRWFHKITFGLG